jgi:SAM-dependent methyltransferase
MTWKTVVKEFVPPIVMKAIRPPPPSGGGYIPAAKTVAAAQAAGLSVCDYVEQLWGIGGSTASIIEKLCGLGAISPATKTIVEIGPGTGRYIEHTIKHCRPTRYQIYEIDNAWSSWLGKNYPIEVCAADGRSLKSTASKSTDLIHAHGVFVYLPFLVSYRYFKEMTRVAAPGAFIVFDMYSERCLDAETVEKWIESGHEFPCFLSTAYVRQVFERAGFRFVDSFLWAHGTGWSEYLVFMALGDDENSLAPASTATAFPPVPCRPS